MLIVENKKIEARILKLKFEIEERQSELKELEKLLEGNNEIINSCDSNSLKMLNKCNAKLYSVISALPEEQRIGWTPTGNFKCNMCLQTFREGFNSIHDHNLFFYKNPQYKHLSNYCLKHSPYSICYKNQFCSHCDDNDIEYKQFNFRTERVRHIKKHKDEGICVPCNKADKSKEEIIAMFQEQASKLFGKRKLPNVKIELKEESESSSTAIEESEEEEQSSSSPEPVVKKIIKRKKLKIVSPTPTLDYDTDYSITTMESDNESPNNEIKNNNIFTPISISRPIYNI